METLVDSGFLFSRVFLTRTGFHFARKLCRIILKAGITSCKTMLQGPKMMRPAGRHQKNISRLAFFRPFKPCGCSFFCARPCF